MGNSVLLRGFDCALIPERGKPSYFTPLLFQTAFGLVGEDCQFGQVEAARPDVDRRAREDPRGHREGRGHGEGRDAARRVSIISKMSKEGH